MNKTQWFDVSKEGLKELQQGKPKHFLARELIQNAWDEQITFCSFDAQYEAGLVEISVIDDNPTGFADLTDSFTLFKSTSKRSDPMKRGRFNIGEKQALSICNEAEIATTKGTVIFDKNGRTLSKAKRDSGSRVTVSLRMSKQEFNEMLFMVKKYHVPEHINFTVNGIEVEYRKPYKVINTILTTENETNGIFTKTQRKTDVYIYKNDEKSSMLYELGLPITEIDCQFDIDVQQKVPLSIDRDTVSASYLKSVFAETLNATYEDIEDENSSEGWIRQGMSDKRITKEAVVSLVEKRFGDKVAVANPFDPISIDDAISDGYNVVYGSELSKEEWENIRKSEAIISTSILFGSQAATYLNTVEADEDMRKVADLAKKIAQRLLHISINVRFIESDATQKATFDNNLLTFNVVHLKNFFKKTVSAETIDLIVHEIAHSKGHHTEKSYLDCITEMAGRLTMIALNEKEFFDIR